MKKVPEVVVETRVETRVVRLLEKHTDNGVTHYPGEEITLDKDAADWLGVAIVEQRVAVAEQAASIPGTPEYEAAHK